MIPYVIVPPLTLGPLTIQPFYHPDELVVRPWAGLSSFGGFVGAGKSPQRIG